jgi:hypothetical protein
MLAVKRRVRTRFFMEIGLGITSAVLALLTFVWTRFVPTSRS